MLTPKYLLSKNFHKDTIIALVLFSIIFIFFFRPFSGEVWFSLSSFEFRSATISFYSSAVGFVVLSRIAMCQLCSRIKSLDIILYTAWLLLEVAVVTLLYMLFAKGVNGCELVFGAYARTYAAVAAILGIPTAAGALLGAFIHQRKELEDLKLLVREQSIASQDKVLNFYDSKDELKFSALSTSIYYIVAQDNYVQIFYDIDGRCQSYLLRSSIQRVERLLGETALVRCHRSYIVNLDHVQEYLKGRSNSTLVLDDPETKAIPVSKSYANLIPASITGRAVSQVW